MNRFYKFVTASIIFIASMFILQFLNRHNAMMIVTLNFIMIGYQFFLFWRITRWLDE